MEAHPGVVREVITAELSTAAKADLLGDLCAAATLSWGISTQGVEMGALSPQQVLRVLTIVIAAIVLAATSVPSLATGSPSNAELREAIKALEARVVALEAQLQQKTDSQQEASIP